VKPTIIFTSASLVEQWMDEFRKHAPGLKVERYHRTKPAFLDHHEKLMELDAIITTWTFEWSDEISRRYQFHRLVVDESHLLKSMNNMSILANDGGNKQWCVTGTSCDNGDIGILETQLQESILGGKRNYELRLS
jgi:hypothetical protein